MPRARSITYVVMRQFILASGSAFSVNLDTFFLISRTAQESLELDVLEQQANDLIWGIIISSMTQSGETRVFHESKLPEVLACWSEHLKRTQKWAGGERLTYVDFLLYEALDWNREFKPEAFKGHQVLLDYMRRFEDLPRIKEYFGSSKYKKWPILAPHFHWGFKKE